MKKILIMALMAAAIMPIKAENATSNGNVSNSSVSSDVMSEKQDTVRIRYIHRLTEDDARIFENNLQKKVMTK